MNPMITSRESILEVSRNLIMEKGNAINIRAVAAACGISIGTVYNYFGSKSELVAATIESVWADIFRAPEELAIRNDFIAVVSWIYDRIGWGNEKYPGFLAMHAVSFMEDDKADGRVRMEKSWQRIQAQMLAVLKNDHRVRSDAFDGKFTEGDFIKLVFSVMLAAMLQKDHNCDPLLEMIKRAIY